MKKKQKVQIFKLEERVLFDGAAAAEIVAAVNNADNADNNADQDPDDSEQGKEDKFVKDTVQNAGPVDAPAADANVRNAGEGIPQADAAQNDPADVLIQGHTDFTQAADAAADYSGDVAEFIQAAADPDADAAAHELIVIDADAADQFDADQFDGKNVLFLDGDSDAADQIADWLNEHSDRSIDSIQLVTDSDTLASQLGDFDADVISVEAFQAELDAADNLVIMPDHDTNISVAAPAASLDDDLPDELLSDADADRHELVIVNSGMAELDNVLDQLGDSRDVLVIDSSSDAFEQISEYLDNSDTSYDAVHILTHGNDQGFYLGHQKVTAADRMAVFDGHLADNADFMLYGCDLASSEHGQALIHDIADLTGADVAASTNITGAAELGGDWVLEYNSGAIETAAITLDASWDHQLVTKTIGTTGDYADLNAYFTAGIATGDVVEYIENMGDTSMTAPFVIDGGETITITANGYDVTITSDFDVTGGTLTLAGVGVLGDVSVSVGSTLTLDTDGTSEASIAGSAIINGTLNVNNDVGFDTIQLNAGSTFTYTSGVAMTGNQLDSFIDITIDNTHQLTVNGTLTMENGATLTLKDNVTANEIDLKAGSGFAYDTNVQINAGIVSEINLTIDKAVDISGTVRMENGTTLAIDTTSVDIAKVEMANGTTLALNADAAIGEVDLLSGSTFNYTNGVTLTGGIDFHSGAKFYESSAADPGASNVTLSAGNNLTINGTLTMEDGTALAQNVDTHIGTIELQNNSAFSYTSGVTLYGGIDSYIDLTFDQAEYTIKPFDNSGITAPITLHAGAMTVNSGSTLNLYGTVIDVAGDSAAVNAIINNGTVNFHWVNTMRFSNSVNNVYAAVVNTGIVNIVTAGTAPTSTLSVDFTNVNTSIEKDVILNNGASAEININAGALAVFTSTNTVQPVRAISNVQGKTSGLGGVVITNGSTVTLNTNGKDGATIFNAKDQVVTIGTSGDKDGSQVTLITGSGQNIAVENNGKLNIFNSYVKAAGSKAIGVFNGTDGVAAFTVDVTPDQYLTAADLAGLSADLRGDLSNLVYGITATTTSVYNLNKFTASTDQLTFTGAIDGIDVTDVPVAALNGNVRNETSASGNPPVLTLTNMTVNGNILQSGNSKAVLTDIALNGNLSNTLGNVFITGYFGHSGSIEVDGNTQAALAANLSVLNNDALGTFGNIYFGTRGDGTEGTVTFTPEHSYSFTNEAGTMEIYRFTGLSSADNPVQIINYGEFFMDSDPAGETAYDLYVTGTYPDPPLAAPLLHADGITDTGIFNRNLNGYNETYEIPHRMELTDLNIRNVNAQSAAVTNYGGVLTVTRGSLQGTHSGIDMLVDVWEDSYITHMDHYIATPVTTLTDLTKIAGSAYSIRNSGDLTMTAEHVNGGTLLTNNLDFIPTESGSYVAVGNYTFSVFINEYYNSTTSPGKVLNRFNFYGYSGVQKYSVSYTFADQQSSSSLTPTWVNVYSMSAGDINTRSKFDLSNYDDTNPHTGAAVAQTDWNYGDYAVVATADISGVAFQASASTYANTAIFNWGNLSVKGINADADYRFTGFKYSINNGSTTYWVDQDGDPGPSIFGKTTANFYTHFTPYGEYEIGFNLPATSVLTSSVYTGSMTIRGVEDTPGSGMYTGGLTIDGGRYVVYKTQVLALENFSVTAKDSDAIFNAGTLLIFNGTGSETTGWTGPSNALITATDHTAIVNKGRLRMINGAIRDSETAIQQESQGLLSVINSTLYDNTTGIVSELGAPGSGMNFEVIDSTIVSTKDNSVGIRLANANGQLDLVNSIILVKGGTGLDNSVKATVDAHDSANIYGSGDADTLAKMNEVYGTDFTGIESLYDTDLNVLYLVDGSTALSGGVAVGYTVNKSGVYEFFFGGDASTSAILVTADKGGNARGEAIGSYVLTGSPAPTVTIVVNTLKDGASDPDGKEYSLRYVIDYLMSAENSRGVTTVEFDWTALAAEASAGGLSALEFTVDGGTISITGGNPANITEITIDVSGNTTDLAVVFGTDAITQSLFTISGMRVTLTGAAADTFTVNGSGTDTAPAGVDGAAFNLADAANTELILNQVTVTGGNTTGKGGAVYVAGENATLSGTGAVFSNNTAADGGAVYNNGGTVLIDGSFTGNNATANGGALYNAAGTATITGDLDTNTAAQNGGAIYNAADATAAVTGNITGATGVNGAAKGAGVYNAGTLTISGNLETNTASADGGAIYNDGGTVTVTGNLTGNKAVNGGAIYNASGSVTLTGNLDANEATGDGAAIYNKAGSVEAVGDVTGNTGANIIYAADGRVRLGSLEGHVWMTGNKTDGGNCELVKQVGGDVLIINAAIRENDAGEASLFDVSGGVFTLLNSTVTGNDGNVLTQSGGKVQLGDSTIAFNADDAQITVTGGTLDVLNSIINVSNDFSATHEAGSLINEDVNRIFALKSGAPQDGANGTLVVKLSGAAGRGGVMVGYTIGDTETTLYYTTDGQTWHAADGSDVPSAEITVVENSQNDSARLYNGYAFLSIGAYSLKATELSLVVTISGDESQDGETTLRDAMEYAEYLYLLNGTVQTVTFKVKEVYLNSTITVGSPVTVKGTGVTVYAAAPGAGEKFAGDSVFIVDGSNSLAEFKGLTVVGMKGVRGFRVDRGTLDLRDVTVQYGQADGSVAGSQARGGAVYVKSGASLTGSGLKLNDNLAGDGAAIYSEAALSLNNFSVTGNKATAGNVIYVKGNLLFENATLNDNRATGGLIKTPAIASLVTVSASGNTLGGSMLSAGSADIVNSTLSGNAGNAPMVDVSSDLNVANSIIVTDSASGTAVRAGEVFSAYSIYSGSLDNAKVNVGNVTGMSAGALFAGRAADGRMAIAADSPAAEGVWTMYDSETRQIAYSERPEGVLTVKYTPENMTWRYLSGEAAQFQSSLLVGSSSMPSIGAYWLTGGSNHPDYGPGVNGGMSNPSANGELDTDWGYSSVVTSYLANPGSSLSDDSESGMGWYAAMLSDLFGFKGQRSGVLSVFGGLPEEELDLSVDAGEEDFGEFQEAPYHAQDGTPLSDSELSELRSAAITGRMPAESVHLDAEISGRVAASLRTAEPFKDGFDKALDYLLGQDA